MGRDTGAEHGLAIFPGNLHLVYKDDGCPAVECMQRLGLEELA